MILPAPRTCHQSSAFESLNMTFPLRWCKRRPSRHHHSSVYFFFIIHLKTTRWTGRRLVIKLLPAPVFVLTLVRLVNIHCCASRHRALMSFPRGTIQGLRAHAPLVRTPLRFRFKRALQGTNLAVTSGQQYQKKMDSEKFTMPQSILNCARNALVRDIIFNKHFF